MWPRHRANSVAALKMPEHKAAGWTTPIWDTYKGIVNAAEGKTTRFVEVERFAVSDRPIHDTSEGT
jgi:hypothetical protein